MHQATQYEDDIILHNQLIGVSDNSQTINKISLTQLIEVFNKHIKDHIVSTHWLLVLDSYNSYVSPKFDRFCLDHQIVVLYIPAHLLHLLQPLDIGCFSVLKQSYGRLVKQLMGRGINHINKCEFLPLYRQVRQAALHRNNILAGFAATSLVPYSPNRVLVQLYTKYWTLLP